MHRNDPYFSVRSFTIEVISNTIASEDQANSTYSPNTFKNHVNETIDKNIEIYFAQDADFLALRITSARMSTNQRD